MRYKHVWMLCLAFTISGVALTSNLQTRSHALVPPGQRQVKQAEEVDSTKFPIVHSDTAKSADPIERAKREAKSKKYNRRHSPPITESSNLISVSSDWALRLPAFPVARSLAVIVGEITKAQAHLSEDGTEIYSEFAFRIDEVLKCDGQPSSAFGNTVLLERSGGRMRFPSGKIVVSRTVHQDMPRVGKRYVLFLTHDSPAGGEDEDFYILTGYELRDGQVFPLDKLPAGHPITAQKGTSEASFFNALQQSLTSTAGIAFLQVVDKKISER